jgi:hypothetical protein
MQHIYYIYLEINLPFKCEHVHETKNSYFRIKTLKIFLFREPEDSVIVYFKFCHVLPKQAIFYFRL